MRRLALLAALAAVLALAGVAHAATRSVTVGDNWYVRSQGVPTVTVKRGDTVRWVNRGRAPHNVVVTKGPQKFRSGFLLRGGTYRKRVTRRGTYTIICTIHGAADQSMRLRVR